MKASYPFLADILRDGLLRVHNQLTPTVECDQYPNRYHNLIQSQNKIGWLNLYRGKWSLEWRQLHNRYSARNAILHDGKTWVQKCGKYLIDRWLTLWKLRNDERHGADQIERRQKLKTTLTHQLEQYYSLQPEVVPFDRQLLFPFTNAETHLQASTDMDGLQEWILDHTILAKASIQQAHQQQRQGTQDIRTSGISSTHAPSAICLRTTDPNLSCFACVLGGGIIVDVAQIL